MKKLLREKQKADTECDDCGERFPLWDALEMGAPADVHCYTPPEFERKRLDLRVVREAAETGLDLLPQG